MVYGPVVRRLHTGNDKSAIGPVPGNTVLVAVSEQIQTGKSKLRHAVSGQGKPGVQAVLQIEIKGCEIRVTGNRHILLLWGKREKLATHMYVEDGFYQGGGDQPVIAPFPLPAAHQGP
jgi:hypothetical protein